MSVFETIQHRRSIGKMTTQEPTREQITQLLNAAVHAPNHHKVEPWRFFVLRGQAREELGKVMAQSLAERMEETESKQSLALLEKERQKPLRSPILIIAAAEPAGQKNVLMIENVEATAAAVQNMLLAAEEMGLAAMWRTGEAAYDPQVKAWLGLTPEHTIVSILYLGYPAIPHQERHSTPIEHKTTWLGWYE